MYCSKTSFATEKDAEFYIEKLKKTSNRDKIPKRAYLCTECFHWHLTSIEEDYLDGLRIYMEFLEKRIKTKEKKLRILKRIIKNKKRELSNL